MWIGPGNADEVEVPHLVGLTVAAAREVAWKAGLVVAAEDPDGPPLGALTWPGVWLVTAQHPAAGAIVHRRGSVIVEFQEWSSGEEAGDRVPRSPVPPLDVLAAERGVAEDAD